MQRPLSPAASHKPRFRIRRNGREGEKKVDDIDIENANPEQLARFWRNIGGDHLEVEYEEVGEWVSISVKQGKEAADANFPQVAPHVTNCSRCKMFASKTVAVIVEDILEESQVSESHETWHGWIVVAKLVDGQIQVHCDPDQTTWMMRTPLDRPSWLVRICTDREDPLSVIVEEVRKRLALPSINS